MPNYSSNLDINSCTPAYVLAETNRQASDYSGFRRYQSILVKLNDKPMLYQEDLGPTWSFVADPFRIVGYADEGGKDIPVETVGRLKEMAIIMRMEPLGDFFKDPERFPRMDLIGEYWNEMERRSLGTKSSFGPYLKVQR